MALSTDVLVIGAGPGGYVGAIKLGKLGKKTFLVEKDKLGGECLNYGCIPSKALIHAADEYYQPKAAQAHGMNAAGLGIDWAKVQVWKNNVIGGFVRGIASLEKGNKVDVLAGAARLTGPNSAVIVKADGEETVQFAHALISTGTRPAEIPGFSFDGESVLSSKEALELPAAPERLAVIGGGVIGLEIGTFFAKLGTKVTVVEFMDQVLPGVPSELVSPVLRSLQKLGVEILTKSQALGYERTDGGLSVRVKTAEGEKTIAADKILLSVGRVPITKDLGLDAAGVETDAKGHIKVNARYQTNVPHIYAAGDVIGAPYLAHKASQEAIVAALAIAGFETHGIGAVPWTIFTDPEIAFVGETEEQIRARGREPIVGRFPFAASGRAQAVAKPEGFYKVVADKETREVLGVAIVGGSASDLIGEGCLAVKLKATVEDIAEAIHPHPTLCESIVDAAEACVGQAVHILPPVVREPVKR
ncbi:MAG TPA: dihydrolipoyl dehydrogenase [Elusimicrobiota bacterium]|nr:dihydrolipoyl dehydrogenase [Elusimicrobiota bacterium]